MGGSGASQKPSPPRPGRADGGGPRTNVLGAGHKRAPSAARRAGRERGEESATGGPCTTDAAAPVAVVTSDAAAPVAVATSDAAAPVAVAGARSGKVKMPSRSPGRKNSSVSVPVSVPVGVAATGESSLYPSGTK